MTPGNETVSPKVSTLTKVFYATSVNAEQKTQIAYVQSISEFLSLPQEIKYSALDIEDERMAKGKREANAPEIPFLYTEDQWDELRAVEEINNDVWLFFVLPESTAKESGKPLTFYFKGSLAVSMDAIEIDDMLKSKVKIYRSSAIKESKGFPTAA